MKKQLMIVGITVLVIVVGLSGCTEKRSIDNLVVAPLITLSLTLDDLPQGYIKQNEFNSTNGAIKNITLEYYSVYLVYEFPYNTRFPALILNLAKCNSSNDANIVLYNLSEQALSTADSLNRITPQDVQKMGDESIFEVYEETIGEHDSSQNMTYSFCFFRIKNVVVYLLLTGNSDWDIDYVSLTIDYAKVMEKRINES